MAKSKSTEGVMKTATLPSNVRKLRNQLTWNPEELPLLEGDIDGFGNSPARNFHDGNWFPGKTQRFAKIAPTDGDGETIYIVYEGGGLSPLFDLDEGSHVAIAFTGMRKVEGRRKPTRVFEVGVYD
jgi:hypothetical protein